jgi:uncharacterized membrane protein
MSTLVVLLISFCLMTFINRYILNDTLTLSLMGRVAMSVMLLFSGSSHFFKTGEMIQMMPEFLPFKIELVYLTGIMELAFAASLLFSRYTKWTVIALILFFLAILPANIVGSIKKVPLGGMENGPVYLYFRIPLQLLFIGWAYYFGIRLAENPAKKASAIR